MLDTLIHKASIPHYNHLMDVGVQNGSITYLSKAEERLPHAKQIMDADGRVLLPGLIEPHIHLDKAYLLDQMNEDATTLDEAIQLTGDLKKGFTKDDIKQRSIKVLEKCISYGVTNIRCHVEVDPIVGLKGMEVLLELKQQYRDRIDLQLVTFPQEGIFQQKGTAELLEESLIMGADVVGGIPYNDPNPIGHLDLVFDLAHRFDKALDFHVDFSDNPKQLAIKDIVSRTLTYGLEGRVAVGHLTSLGSVPQEEAKQIAKDIAKAGIHVMTLPATDLFLNGRSDKERVRRGVTPVKLLLEEGANVIVGTNNIQNPFTPFGTGDPLDVALLLAHVAQMGTLKDSETLLDMTTIHAAKALGIQSHGIALNNQADLVLFDTKNTRNVLLERPKRLAIWKKGIQVNKTALGV
ncbi:amidohydrolase family protein [Aquibacillus albus]|uniref:Cytosine deaminase n=1 Tax=Aquibacillus albus TaxID=1168171 RepID=A0ABS2MVW3_9BACI|nr:amidohydrolase family protein [Aquibacillus albus]MBM7570039.1 cytosine deaminase [Aquibacillus albus]